MSKHAIADGLLFTYTCPAAWSVYAAFIKRHQLLHECWEVPGIGKSESLKKLKRKGMKVKNVKLRKMRKRDVLGFCIPRTSTQVRLDQDVANAMARVTPRAWAERVTHFPPMD